MTRWRPDHGDGDATPEPLWLRRREFLALGAAGAGALLVGARLRSGRAAAAEPSGAALQVARRVEAAGGEKPNAWDEITGDNAYLPNAGDFPVVKGKFIVAGVTHDVNSRLSWSLDWQQQSPNGAPAPALDLRTYNVHVSAAF